jgi:hypothetical protein
METPMEKGEKKLTVGTVPHVAQSPDSDSDAFFMVIETAVDAHPGGGVEKRPKTSFHHSTSGRQQTCEISIYKTNKCQYVL